MEMRVWKNTWIKLYSKRQIMCQVAEWHFNMAQLPSCVALCSLWWKQCIVYNVYSTKTLSATFEQYLLTVFRRRKNTHNLLFQIFLKINISLDILSWTEYYVKFPSTGVSYCPIYMSIHQLHGKTHRFSIDFHLATIKWMFSVVLTG